MGQSNSNLAPRTTTSCPGPNNLPPLGFHADAHGDNIRISRDGRTAKRVESFCKGITFSSRPVRVNERVCIRFAEISNNWSGVIRFGFTYNDPAMLRNSLPKYACPELTNKPGYWAKALNERFCERDNVLFYYVTSSGDVHFGVNGEEKGVFITGVETRSPLWAIIDVYGNCTSIEFLDSRIYMVQSQQQQHPVQNHYHHRRSITAAEQDLENVIPAIQSMGIRDEYSPSIPALRYNHAISSRLVAVPFHKTKGRNVRLSPDNCIATRVDTDFCQGYVFTARPLRIGEKLIVQIMRTERMYVGALALGLTSCDPATLVPADLPDDCDLLLDRPEYWVVSKDVASTPQLGDEITFCVTLNGEVQISKNGGPPSVVMHVDQSLQLWAFLDVYGSTQSVRVLSQPPSPPLSQSQQISQSIPVNNNNQNSVCQLTMSPRRLQVSLHSSDSANSLNGHAEACRKIPLPSPPTIQPPASRVINLPSNDMIQLKPGGTVLVVNLPPTHSDIQSTSSAQQQQQQHVTQPRISQVPITTPGSSNTMMSNYSNTYVEPISVSSSNYTTHTSWQDSTSPQHTTGAECTICYENSIDSVLYMCGHMCMCYECALQQWKGIGGGHCPLCRAIIRDVIRTYKS